MADFPALNLNFLFAADRTPITKTITNGEVTPYPNIREFTSYTQTVETHDEIKNALEAVANEGGCLLKGQLDRPLINESRAGHTSPLQTTRYLLLDLDFNDGFYNLDDFLAQLDPALANVTYFFQLSASAALSPSPKLRGHLLIILKHEVLPDTLKAWLMHKNMSVPGLKKLTTLSANGLTLKYPLDISTCQNDKLIFIAPPFVENTQVTRPVVLVRRDNDIADLQQSLSLIDPSATHAQIQERINELRSAANLPKRTATYTSISGDLELLSNPDPINITGIKEARGFVYLNLNGGDSWAYYFPKDDPSFLRNFKGEPILPLPKVAPNLYYEYTKQRRETLNKEIDRFVVHDRLTDTYLTVHHHKGSDHVELYEVGNKTKVMDFYAQYELPAIEAIPDWDVIFDPTTNVQIDHEKRTINRFHPSEYMKRKYTREDVKPFPVIQKIIQHIAGDLAEHLLNSLAVMFQYRIKTQTAFVFSGTSGTGKGLFLHEILMPLFGHQYVKPVLIAQLEDQFNSYIHETLATWIDEAHIDSTSNSRIINRLKNLITETEMPLRLMRTNLTTVTTYNSVFLATNHRDPVPIDAADRRFNVCTPQFDKLEITQEEVDQIPDELHAFAAYLYHHQACRETARRVVHTEARQDMMEVAMNSVDRFFKALKEGDLEHFLTMFEGNMKLVQGKSDLFYMDYAKAVSSWSHNIGQLTHIPRSQIEAVYAYMIGKQPSPTAFTRMAAMHNLKIVPARVNGKVIRGLPIKFKLENNVLPFEASTDDAEIPKAKTK